MMLMQEGGTVPFILRESVPLCTLAMLPDGPMLREMTDDLPTARTMAPTGLRVHVWCKACRHSVDADFDALIRDGKGDVPLVQLKWQCAKCRSGLTDFVVSGAHFGPRRA
jgi:hypothetical protein